jgi:hypothetical protein
MLLVIAVIIRPWLLPVYTILCFAGRLLPVFRAGKSGDDFTLLMKNFYMGR